MQKNSYIPPSGVIGAQSQTQAGQAALLGFARGVARSRSRSARKSRATSRRTSKKRAKPSYGRLKAGSAAAKAWGRKMRRLRKR